MFAVLQWLRNVIDWFRIPFSSSRALNRMVYHSPSFFVRLSASSRLLKRARYYSRRLEELADDPDVQK